ncbi:efflux RND transporter periplasmic adaptor subunit [Sulfurovum sp.]|uniref:efflux RND transporter periplasmic adaptor subunit n=1 Tax=Sulfurovum sp. TaxID=1969726 RepID=UPI0028681162|nr:efflux RND transporter periplasmic adaptor subunit [Sulfurovum sp.]
MLKILLILIVPFILYSETTMKCEAGKCASDNAPMTKNIPSKPVRSQKPTIEQLFNVKTVQVKEMITSPKQINFGYIVAQDSRKVDVFAWYSGFVDTLYADSMYKKVVQGELLAKVYSPEVYQAKQDYLNSINYNADHTAPGMLQSAMTKLSLLGVSKKEIENIKKERNVDEFTMIYAPISGWIFEKNINQGSSFSSKKKLFQIIDLDKVWAEVKLFQNELTKLDTLRNFKVMPKSTNKVYEAEKSLLYPMLDPREATATLRLILDNEDGMLKPGMYVKVHSSSADKRRLVIPRTAAIRKNGIWYAFLATEFKGEYEPIAIDIKPLDNKHFEVIKGLKTSDILVNNALFMMDSDAQINGIY